MTQKKGFLDSMFDMADSVLTPMEKVLSTDDPIDADFVDMPDKPAPQEQDTGTFKKADTHQEWEAEMKSDTPKYTEDDVLALRHVCGVLKGRDEPLDRHALMLIENIVDHATAK